MSEQQWTSLGLSPLSRVRDEALTLVAPRAREVADAPLVAILLHHEVEGTLMVETLESTEPIEDLLGQGLAVQGRAFETVLGSHQPISLDYLGKAAAPSASTASAK